MKLLEESIGITLYDVRLGKVFLDMTSKAHMTNLNWTLTSSLYFKEHHQEKWGEATEWKKNIWLLKITYLIRDLHLKHVKDSTSIKTMQFF